MILKNRMIVLTGSFIFMTAPFIANAEISEATTPTDSQIVEIVTTVNHAEINAAEVAKKSTDKEVSGFADHMIMAHSKSDKGLNQLEKKNDIGTRNSTWSEKLKIDTGNQLAALKKLSGKDLDKEYISDQVKDHTDVLGMFDKSLIPNARDAKLKSLLANTRGEVAKHLELAKKVQAGMHE